MAFWDDIEKFANEVVDTAKVAFDKTVEYGKIGKKTVELKLLQSDFQKEAGKLGSFVFKFFEEKANTSLSKEGNDQLAGFFKKMNEIKSDIEKKEAEIQELKDSDEGKEEEKKEEKK